MQKTMDPFARRKDSRAGMHALDRRGKATGLWKLHYVIRHDYCHKIFGEQKRCEIKKKKKLLCILDYIPYFGSRGMLFVS